jgi:DtxR family Mn-dependent transcriptional regulator
MIRKLSEKRVITYVKYQGVNITEKGKKRALWVIRKHRLWEVFLVNKLGFHWDEVHEIAEQLEHIKSSLLITRLDEFLGFPKFDPHGDPNT